MTITFISKTFFVNFVFMFPDSSFKIIGNPYIKDGVVVISHKIDIAVHHYSPWGWGIPGQARNDDTIFWGIADQIRNDDADYGALGLSLPTRYPTSFLLIPDTWT